MSEVIIGRDVSEREVAEILKYYGFDLNSKFTVNNGFAGRRYYQEPVRREVFVSIEELLGRSKTECFEYIERILINAGFNLRKKTHCHLNEQNRCVMYSQYSNAAVSPIDRSNVLAQLLEFNSTAKAPKREPVARGKAPKRTRTGKMLSES